MGAEEKIILINDLISSLEEIKQDESLLRDFQIYVEPHGVHVLNKNNDIISTRKIYKNIEIVLPIESDNALDVYDVETILKPF